MTLALGSVGAALAPISAAAQWRSIPTPARCETQSTTAATDGQASSTQLDLAVITFYVHSAPAVDRYLADALADHLAYWIPYESGISAVSREGIRRPPPTQPAEAAQTARALGARFLLSGTIRGAATGTQLTTTLYGEQSGAAIWEGSYELGTENALEVARRIRTEVVSRVRLTGAAAEASDGPGGGTTVSSAFEQFLRGLDADRERGPRYYRRAIDYFREAVRRDPRFVEGHARLALAITRALENGLTDATANAAALLADARAAADQALAIDSTFALAWLARASVLSLGGSASAARAAFQRAASLDPLEPETLWREAAALFRQGRRADGERRLRAAAALAARYAPASADLGALALFARQTDVACRWLNDAIGSDPYAAAPYALRSTARRRHGELRLAWADAEIATRLGARLLGETAAALVDMTARDSVKARARARWVMRQVERRTRLSQLEARFVASLLIGIGERERALRAIDKAFPRDGYLALMLQDDQFAPIAGDDRYRRVMRVAR